MRLLRRNTTEFEYLPPTDEETDLNNDGEHTGDFHPQYGDPIVYRGNISSPSGHTTHQFFGEEVRYTHTLVMDRQDIDITEHGMIRWKGDLYDVTAVRPSLNGMSIALRRNVNPPEVPYVPDQKEDETQEEAGDGE